MLCYSGCRKRHTSRGVAGDAGLENIPTVPTQAPPEHLAGDLLTAMQKLDYVDIPR